MISLFDTDDAFADDSAMGYQRYTTDFKLACLKRYFTPPMKPVRDLAAELCSERLFNFISEISKRLSTIVSEKTKGLLFEKTLSL